MTINNPAAISSREIHFFIRLLPTLIKLLEELKNALVGWGKVLSLDDKRALSVFGVIVARARLVYTDENCRSKRGPRKGNAGNVHARKREGKQRKNL